MTPPAPRAQQSNRNGAWRLWAGAAVSLLFLWLANYAMRGVELTDTARIALLLLFTFPAMEGAVREIAEERERGELPFYDVGTDGRTPPHPNVPEGSRDYGAPL